MLPLRVFLWHVNNMGGLAPWTVWILLRTGSGTATLTDHRSLAPAPPAFPKLRDRGRCLAKAQLFGTITEAGYHTGTSINASSDVGLGNHQIANNETVTAIHEFTVTGTAGQVLDLRTIVTKDSDFGQPYNQCLLPDHIRGWWPFSELLAFAAIWDAGQLIEPANQYHASICESGGKDQQVFAWQGEAADPFGYPKVDDDDPTAPTGNRGLFGVNARYRVRLYNTHNLVRYVAFNLRARNTGAPYFGAALALEEDALPSLGGVPPIKKQPDPPNPPDPQFPHDAVRIRHSDSAVPANRPFGDPVERTVRNATAGSATMPVDLRLVSSPTPTPENGP